MNQPSRRQFLTVAGGEAAEAHGGTGTAVGGRACGVCRPGLTAASITSPATMSTSTPATYSRPQRSQRRARYRVCMRVIVLSLASGCVTGAQCTAAKIVSSVGMAIAVTTTPPKDHSRARLPRSAWSGRLLS